ncbi:MAG: radical SAM protein [Candidatus Fermentibacteraceae bacterium]
MRATLSRFFRRTHRFPGIALRDRRRHLVVRMDTTNHCNLRCFMCPMRFADTDPERKWLHMDHELFAKIRRQVFPLASMVSISCGAEPFCNPRIGSHLKALCESGVPAREMVTNGTLLDREKIALLLQYPPTTLFVSIDGARPETHAAIRGGADLERIIENLETLVRIRGKRHFPMLAFSTTLQKANLAEIPELVELAARVGARALGLVPLVPYKGLGTLDSVVDPGSEPASAIIKEAGVIAGRLGISLEVACGEAREAECPYLAKTVYLAPDGAVFPCPYWNTGNPIGNLTEEDFGPVWRRRYDAITESTCRDCPEVNSRRSEITKDH